MQVFAWFVFVAFFFVLRLILKGSGKVVDIAADAYKTVNSKEHQSSYKSSQQKNGKVFCVYCGTQNDTDSRFCIKCGKVLEQNKLKNPFENTVFGYAITLVAYVAKADGYISENEAEVIAILLSDMSNDDEDIRKLLKQIYEEAKNAPVKNHADIARKILVLSRLEFSQNESEEYNNIFIKWLVMLVYADNKKNLKQNLVVDEIANIMQINKLYLQELHKKFESANNNQSSNSSSSSSMDDNYKILKCKPTDTDDDIKKAYRELAKQYHPDTISGKGLAEDFILFATHKFKEINSAYEAIKKQRGMK